MLCGCSELSNRVCDLVCPPDCCNWKFLWFRFIRVFLNVRGMLKKPIIEWMASRDPRTSALNNMHGLGYELTASWVKKDWERCSFLIGLPHPLCPSQDSFPLEEIKYRPICKCSRLQHLIFLVFPFLAHVCWAQRNVSGFWRNLGVKSLLRGFGDAANSVTAQMCIWGKNFLTWTSPIFLDKYVG